MCIRDRQRAALAGALAEAELNEGNIREAWTVSRRWFVTVSNRPLPPSRKDLRKVTNDRIKLYSKSLPPIPRAEQRRKSWIFAASGVLVDLKNAPRKLQGPTNQAEYRRLTRCLKLSLKEDRKQRAALAGALAEAELN